MSEPGVAWADGYGTSVSLQLAEGATPTLQIAYEFGRGTLEYAPPPNGWHRGGLVRSFQLSRGVFAAFYAENEYGEVAVDRGDVFIRLQVPAHACWRFGENAALRICADGRLSAALELDSCALVLREGDRHVRIAPRHFPGAGALRRAGEAWCRAMGRDAAAHGQSPGGQS